jgi:peroxiredoxin Q/BCP
MPIVGEPAPDFTLRDQDDNAVTLSQFRGKTVVLYFYPRDATPGCTTEACDFRDHAEEFLRNGAVVLGVSPDNVSSHRKFREKQGLTFPLLADPEKVAIQAYDVWKEKNMYGKKSMGVERSTFVIDAQGIVRKVFAKVRVPGHVTSVLEAVSPLD